MAIKKLNRVEIAKKVENAKPITPVAPVDEVLLEEEVMEEEVVEEDEVMEDEVEEVVVKPVVKTKTTQVKKSTTPTTNKVNNKKGATTMTKKTIGKKSPVKNVAKAERTIGTVYPKDLLLKNIQESLSEEFNISLADLKKIVDAVESNILDACQIASVRFLSGVVKAQERNASVTKSPLVDYHSYTGARKVVTITLSELEQPEKYRGTVNGNKFIANESYNYETGQWEACEGELDMPNQK